MVSLWGVFAIGACKQTTSAPQPDPTVSPSPTPTPLISGSPQTSGTEEELYVFLPKQEVTGVTFSVSGLPDWAEFDPETGKISGYPDQGNYEVTIKGTKDSESTEIPFQLSIKGDPLTQYAWHLRNRGQTSFANHSGAKGEDSNVVDVIRTGIRGTGVTIAISDEGLEILHPDLADNIAMGESRNYVTHSEAPYLGDPTNPASDGDHGTSVAGIAAAVGWNQLGTRGVAPGAKLVGFNFISSNQSLEYALDQLAGNFEVFNQSWGYASNTLFPYADPVYGKEQDTYDEKLVAGVTKLRSSKGAIYVRSAGNNGKRAYVESADVYLGIPATHDPHNVVPQAIVVGAMNAKGERASYSSAGSSLWVSGLAGEYGTADPAMITTDQSGCTKGYSLSTSKVSTFMSGTLALNGSCDYTHTFNGTSSAAPFVSGVVALMLEANSDLGWRDVKHILAATATKVNPTLPAVTRAFDPPGYVSELPWVTNSAGYHFHNYFGFGRVDAKAAVEAAKTHTPLTSPWSSISESSGALSLAIPDFSAAGVTNGISVSSDLVVEAVQVVVDITHAYVSDVGIELISPSGTKSILFNAVSYIDDSNFVSAKFLSNAFYGESAAGTWTLKVVDAVSQDVGTLTQWDLILSGHSP